jgi:hypothetical protein
MRGYSIFVAEGVLGHEWPIYADFNRESTTPVPPVPPVSHTVEGIARTAVNVLTKMEDQWDRVGAGHAATRITLARRILQDAYTKPTKLTNAELVQLRDTLDEMGLNG